MTTLYQELLTVSKSFNETNDCSVKAVAAACGIQYDAAHSALREHGRQDRKGAFTQDILTTVRDLGYIVQRASFSPRAKTLKSISKAGLNSGSYLVFVRGHVAAMVDGQIHDWAADTRRKLLSIYEVKATTTVAKMFERKTAPNRPELDLMDWAAKQQGCTVDITRKPVFTVTVSGRKADAAATLFQTKWAEMRKAASGVKNNTERRKVFVAFVATLNA